MDFFEAQERAKRRTNRLVLLFILAVIGTVLASYAAATLLLGLTPDRPGHARPSASIYWDPQLFGGIALGVSAVVGLASLYKWAQMRHGGSAIAEMVGGRRVDPRTTDLRERRLLNIVEEMAIASGVPVPAVYILDEESAINAFAAGLTTSDAVVAVTRGTLEKLNRDELQGVVGHEFSHILNGDMRLNVKLTAIVFGILVIGLLGRGLLESLVRGRVRSSGSGKNKGGALAVIIAIGVALLIIGYVGYFFGRLIQAAVSRQREFLADASAVQFTRNPQGISTALKKIGGYALGSSLQNHDTAQFSHFLFAQGFRSSFGGLWATHPPLDQRIRAIEPAWDGQLFEPPELVDVEHTSLAEATASAAQRAALRAPVTRQIVREGESAEPPALAALTPPPPPPRIPFQASAVLAGLGQLTEQTLQHAQAKLDLVPAALRDAARDATAAQALTCALLLDPEATAKSPAVAAIRRHASDALADQALAFLPAVAELDRAAKLPLLQLALPALRTLDRAAVDRFATTLDELVHADALVTPFEFALQKMLQRQLALAARPATAPRFQSFHPLVADFSLLLSVLAHADAHAAPDRAARAFAQGVAQLPLIADQLQLRPAGECTLVRLDATLDRLADGSLPIKRRALTAAAHVIGADGQVSAAEAELYRAVAAALDCPAPSLAP